MAIVRGKNDCAFVIDQRIGEGFDRFDIEVVTGFIEDQDVGFAKEQGGHAESSAFSTAEDSDFLLDGRASKEHRAGRIEDGLVFGTWDRFVFEKLQDGFVFWEAGIDVLGVGSEFASIAPFDFAFDRIERVHEGSK